MGRGVQKGSIKGGAKALEMQGYKVRLREMGVDSKNSTLEKEDAGRGKDAEIPPGSTMGYVLKYWKDEPRTEGKEKEKMIKCCCFIWTQEPILKPSVFWPKVGADEDWIYRLWIKYENDKTLVTRKR